MESAKLWYNLLRSVLESDGFKVNPLEPCVMNKVVNGKQCTVVIYVDDLFFTCELEYVIDDTLAVLCKAFESKLVVNSGLEHDYLGMHFNFASVGEVKVTMPGYIEELMKLSSVTLQI